MSIHSQLKDQGRLSENSLNLVWFIENRQADPESGGKVSQGEARRALEADTNERDSWVQPRFYALEEAGVIERVGMKYDPVAKRRVLAFRLTGRLVGEKPATRGIRALLHEALTKLEPHSNLAIEIRDRLKIAA